MMSSKRAWSLLGMVLVADGAAFLLNTSAQIGIWSSRRAPRWYRRSIDFFAAHPALCRTVAAAELFAGAVLLARIGSPAVRRVGERSDV